MIKFMDILKCYPYYRYTSRITLKKIDHVPPKYLFSDITIHG